jgi:succinate dehydrogenase / fumarate reductase cytochrome b subunit
MNRIASLYSSTIGKKFIAAVTGLILFGFLLGHVAGNLKVFTGSTSEGVPHIDEYGQFLRVAGEPFLPEMMGLWIARIVLLASVVLHIVVVVQLAFRNLEARPVGYVRSKKAASTLAALWMMFSGGLIAFFVVFHLLHFTVGALPIGEFQHGAIYKNLYSSFGNPLISLFYVIVMGVIGFHLYHGVWSLFQTLGVDNPDRNGPLRVFAIVATVGIVVGFSLVPLSFMVGALPAPVDYDPSLLGH